MIDDANGGTCVSMPVLYAAVARRLGYPVRLVLTKKHVFCRWDTPNERFNIEATGQGLSCFDDEYYKTFPSPWTETEKKAACYLASLTPSQELACFLASRGHCLLDTGRTQEAHDAYLAAYHLMPQNPSYALWVQQTESRLSGRPPAVEGVHSLPPPETATRMPPMADPSVPQPPSMKLPDLPRPPAPQPGLPRAPGTLENERPR